MNLNIKINVNLTLGDPKSTKLPTEPLNPQKNEYFYGKSRYSFKRYSYTSSDEYKQAKKGTPTSPSFLQIPKAEPQSSLKKQLASLQSDNQLVFGNHRQSFEQEVVPTLTIFGQQNKNQPGMQKMSSFPNSNSNKNNNNNNDDINMHQKANKAKTNSLQKSSSKKETSILQRNFSFSDLQNNNNDQMKHFQDQKKQIEFDSQTENGNNNNSQGSLSILRYQVKHNATHTIEKVLIDINQHQQKVSPFAHHFSTNSHKKSEMQSVYRGTGSSFKPMISPQQSLKSIAQVSGQQESAQQREANQYFIAPQMSQTNKFKHIRYHPDQTTSAQNTNNVVLDSAPAEPTIAFLNQPKLENAFSSCVIQKIDSKPDSEKSQQSKAQKNLTILEQFENGHTIDCKLIRQRKKQWQISILKESFTENQLWTMEDKMALAKQIGMSYHQVSKWHWDERKKRGIDTRKRSVKEQQKNDEQIKK